MALEKVDKVDKALEARVWQRVQSREIEPPLAEPCRVLGLTRELAACYHALARKGLTPAANLERQVRSAGAQLRSLAQLRGCREPEPGPYLPPREVTKGLLDKCCHLERRLVQALYTQRGDPEWGEIYSMLAREAGRRCLTVLEMRGRQR